LADCAQNNDVLTPGDSGGISNTFSIAVVDTLADGSPKYECQLAVFSFTIQDCTESNPAFYTKP
jgi:hypothetical protein